VAVGTEIPYARRWRLEYSEAVVAWMDLGVDTEQNNRAFRVVKNWAHKLVAEVSNLSPRTRGPKLV
jgi:hypothetical protein